MIPCEKCVVLAICNARCPNIMGANPFVYNKWKDCKYISEYLNMRQDNRSFIDWWMSVDRDLLNDIVKFYYRVDGKGVYLV